MLFMRTIEKVGCAPMQYPLYASVAGLVYNVGKVVYCQVDPCRACPPSSPPPRVPANLCH